MTDSLCQRCSSGRRVLAWSCCALVFLAAKPAKPSRTRNTPKATPPPAAPPAPLTPAPPPPATGFTHAPAWLADAYWQDGKAEFNTYDARIVRDGEARPCEVIHILMRETFAPNSMIKADNPQQSGAYPVLKLNQVLHIPAGLAVYQQMHSAFWKVADGSLIKWSMTSGDSTGNTFKEALRAGAKGPDEPAAPWKYEFRTYWQGMEGGEEVLRPPADGCFYEELPAMVRTLDFSVPQGHFPIHLTKSVVNSRRDTLSFAPGEVSYTTEAGNGNFAVTVTYSGGKDEFLLDARPPHVLREWHMADGGEMHLKSSLKIDYWNYNKLGDKERARSEVKNGAE